MNRSFFYVSLNGVFMLLREFKKHYKSGDLESVIAVTAPNNDT